MRGIDSASVVVDELQSNSRPCRIKGIREFRAGDQIVIVPRAVALGQDKTPDQAVSLNASGKAIWELCDGSHSVSEIASVLSERFEADTNTVLFEVRRTVENLSERHLIEFQPTPTSSIGVTAFVVGLEDKPYFRWQIAILLESFRDRLPVGWKTIVAVCNNGQPLSDDLKRILDAYDTEVVASTNHSKRFPIDFGFSHQEYYGPLNRIEALAIAGQHVRDDDVICLLDSDTFLYGDLNLDIMPKGCAAPFNWHIDHKPFFATAPKNRSQGIDLEALLKLIGCNEPYKPGGVNVFVSGRVAKQQKFIADCYRFAHVLFLLGRIKGIELVWMAEMPCFTLSMTANGIPYDLLRNQEFLVPSCREEQIPQGSLYHYYSDPTDFGSGAFLNSRWHKQAWDKENFLVADHRPFLDRVTSGEATAHEAHFFELADRARRRIYMRQTPPSMVGKEKALGTIPALGLGFKKVKLDPVLHQQLRDHFAAHRHHFQSEPNTDYVLTENPKAYPSLLYQDEEFNQMLLSELKAAHEEWSGRELCKAACYGIRVYQRGSYLLNHTDRVSTHVVSSTICVDYQLDAPWPLYIEDLEGNPHEVMIEPGEMVFFEGALLTHGRPYPMLGDYYANIFVHYTPLDWTLRDPEA